jgi:hypothetical protein
VHVYNMDLSEGWAGSHIGQQSAAGSSCHASLTVVLDQVCHKQLNLAFVHLHMRHGALKGPETKQELERSVHAVQMHQGCTCIQNLQ